MRLPALLCALLALAACEAAAPPRMVLIAPAEADTAVAAPDTAVPVASTLSAAGASQAAEAATESTTETSTESATPATETLQTATEPTQAAPSETTPDTATDPASPTAASTSPSPGPETNTVDPKPNVFAVNPKPEEFGPAPTGTAMARGRSTGPMRAHEKTTKRFLARINAWRDYYQVPRLEWSDEIGWASWGQSNQCTYATSFEHSQWAYPDLQGTIGGNNYDLNRLVDYFALQPYDASQPGQLHSETNYQAVPFAILMWRKATAVGCSWVKCDHGVNSLLLTCMVDTHGSFTYYGDNQLYWDNIPLRP